MSSSHPTSPTEPEDTRSIRSDPISAVQLSSDSLVEIAYPQGISFGSLRTLKTLLRTPGDPEDVALSYLHACRHSKSSTSDEVENFLQHVAENGVTQAMQLRALEVRCSFVKYRETQCALTPISGSAWTPDELDYFRIEFETINRPNEFLPPRALSAKAKTFVEVNEFITPEYFDEKNGVFTKFSEYLADVLERETEESAVDDMMRNLLEGVLSDEPFLVRSQRREKLHFATESRKRPRPTEATADLVVLKKGKNRERHVTILVVEDKSYSMDADAQVKKAEAQLIANGIAVAQSGTYDAKKPLFLIRVLGTRVTFYSAIFLGEFLFDVRRGNRRIKPFVVKKLIPKTLVDKGRGFNILDQKQRKIVVEVIRAMESEHETS